MIINYYIIVISAVKVQFRTQPIALPRVKIIFVIFCFVGGGGLLEERGFKTENPP